MLSKNDDRLTACSVIWTLNNDTSYHETSSLTEAEINHYLHYAPPYYNKAP